jgi:hypothetical protein
MSRRYWIGKQVPAMIVPGVQNPVPEVMMKQHSPAFVH